MGLGENDGERLAGGTQRNGRNERKAGRQRGPSTRIWVSKTRRNEEATKELETYPRIVR